jgi:hypothetical protein
MCYCSATVGVNKWPMPMQKVEHPDSALRYKWFARLLLEGSVLDEFKTWSESLQVKTFLITQDWRNKKSELLVAPLQAKKIASKAALFKAIRADVRFMLPGLIAFLHPTHHAELVCLWKSIASQE